MGKAILVGDPAEASADPDNLPWTKRLKYVETAELLADYRAANASMARAYCPATDYIAAHLDDDILDVEAFLYAHEDWGPSVLCESMWTTLWFNHAGAHRHGAFIARAVQHYMALHLVRHHPFERARPALQQMLAHPRMRFVSPQAAYVTLAYLNAGHPNPRKLLEKPAVRAKFPADLAVERFAAPDFDRAA